MAWPPALDWGTIVIPSGLALTVAELGTDGVATGMLLCATIPCPILGLGDAVGPAGAPARAMDSAAGRASFWTDPGVSERTSALAEACGASVAVGGPEEDKLDGKEITRRPPPGDPDEDEGS